MMLGMNNWIKQSQQNLDMVLPAFEDAAAAGYSLQEAATEIFSTYNLSDSDFTDSDLRKITYLF